MQAKRRPAATQRLDRRLTERRTIPSNGNQLTPDAKRERTAQIKAAIAYLGITQRRAALESRVAETRFSDIVRGRVTPSAKEQNRISKILKRSKETLFGKTSLATLSCILAGLLESGC